MEQYQRFEEDPNMRMLATVLATLALSPAFAAAPKGKVSFKSPKDGQEVTSPVKVVMDLSGMKLRPAGEDIEDNKTGHHHIIIDGGAIPEGQVIPTDDKHLHYGKAQTEAEVKLVPGEHTLTLQLADGAHRSYGPGLSKTIKVKVK